MARRGVEGLQEFAAMMAVADELDARWREIVGLRGTGGADSFDIESAIDGFNARCRSVLRLVADSADVTPEEVTQAYRAHGSERCWFESPEAGSPAETVRQIARFRTLDPRGWKAKPVRR